MCVCVCVCSYMGEATHGGCQLTLELVTCGCELPNVGLGTELAFSVRAIHIPNGNPFLFPEK